MAKPIAVTTAVPQTFNESALPQLVQLDGSGSSDPDVFPITGYSWTLVYKPPGSAAVLSDDSIVNPTFTADVVGSYLFFLVVTSSDPGDNESETDRNLAPNSALVEVTAETLNFDWHIPAGGARNWTDHLYEIFTEIEVSLAAAAAIATGHTYSRTNAVPAQFLFDDQRSSGGPFATSDHLLVLSNKNASQQGENERGGIELDMHVADAAGEVSFAFEQSSGDGLAVMTGGAGGPWFGLLMKNPVPTGSGVPTMAQMGVDGAEVASAVMLKAFWQNADMLTLLHALDDSNNEVLLRLVESADVDDGGNSTRYLRLFPDHPTTVEDIRLRLERTRLGLRRELFVEIDPTGPDDDYDKDWRIRLWRLGEVAGDQPELGWKEDEKVWYAKGVNNSDVLVRGTGVAERTRVEHGQFTITNNSGGAASKMSAFLTYDRDFTAIPTTLASLLGADPDMEEKVGAVYAAPRAGQTLHQMTVEVHAQVGQTFADGEYVTVNWFAIGHDAE